MSFRGCRGGRMSHRFDKTTHRCVHCQRWQAGFAPKKEFVKPRAECQICERKQAVDTDGALGHHGYTRPGWGFIQGDCFGQGHKPYPATDALVKYLERLEKYLATCRLGIEMLPQINLYEYKTKAFRGPRRDKEVTFSILRGDESHYYFDSGIQVPSFAERESQEKRHLEHEIEYGEHEKARIEKRIAAASMPQVAIECA